MAKSSTTGILGALKALKSTKPSTRVQKKIDVHDAATKDKEAKEKLKKHLQEKFNVGSTPVHKAMPTPNEKLGDELKAILTPKKGGPTLTPTKR